MTKEDREEGASLRDLLTNAAPTLTPSESKIVQILLADYPGAGLGSASSLARRAGVSDPTVARLVNKLGFESFSAFQTHLLEEVEARLRSPLMMLETRTTGAGGSVVSDYLVSVAQRMRDMTDSAVVEPYERAAELITGARGRVHVLGGRFSRHVAGMLSGYLFQLRANVTSLGALNAESADLLLDMGRKDVLIVFDYRRYQTDVVDFARQAAARGVRIILFTDPWLSPLADAAEVMFIASVEVDSPYDSLAPAVAQMEALVAHLVAREKAGIEQRVAELEVLRGRNAITIDTPGPATPARPGPRKS